MWILTRQITDFAEGRGSSERVLTLRQRSFMLFLGSLVGDEAACGFKFWLTEVRCRAVQHPTLACWLLSYMMNSLVIFVQH